jgi:uncharacterized protein YecE (DUF72 family)
MATARVGCSGWDYKDWRGVVYPEELPKRRWFEHYATLFDTVELNATFYRLPSEATAEAWSRQAPPGFLYATKLGQFGTHRMKLRDAATWLPNFFDRVDRLGPSLGPILVQLPPRWKRNADRLRQFFAAAPSRYRWAVEVRDPSWLHDEVYEVLRDAGAALCHHDLLPDHPDVATTDWAYERFHGPNAIEDPYHGAYPRDRLAAAAERLRTRLRRGHDVYAYFNNDWDGHAVEDAAWLRDELLVSGGGRRERGG